MIKLYDQSIFANDFILLKFNYGPLVFLNGCETSRSELQGNKKWEYIGDEQFGFVRALFVANVRTIIVTGWIIEDNMAEKFAREFYIALNKNSIGRPVRIARLKIYFEKNGKGRDWASYILFGNPI